MTLNIYIINVIIVIIIDELYSDNWIKEDINNIIGVDNIIKLKNIW